MRRILATGAALLLCTPAMAQKADWEKVRDALLGPQIVTLKRFCAMGLFWNRRDKSNWDPEIDLSARVLSSYDFPKGKNKKHMVDSTFAGIAAAMKIECPWVW